MTLEQRIQAAALYAKEHGLQAGHVDLAVSDLARDPERPPLRILAIDLMLRDGLVPPGFIAEELEELLRLHGGDPAVLAALRDVAEALGVELTGGRDA